MSFPIRKILEVSWKIIIRTFIVLCTITLVFFVFSIGKKTYEFTSDRVNTYEIYAVSERNRLPIDNKALNVNIKGIKVGIVKSAELIKNNEKVLYTLLIKNKYIVPKGSDFRIGTFSNTGSGLMLMDPDHSNFIKYQHDKKVYLNPGDTVNAVDLVRNFKEPEDWKNITTEIYSDSSD